MKYNFTILLCSLFLNYSFANFNTRIPGDINNDNTLDILDIVSMVDIILLEGDYDICGDMNYDDLLNVLDVIILVELILSGT